MCIYVHCLPADIEQLKQLQRERAATPEQLKTPAGRGSGSADAVQILDHMESELLSMSEMLDLGLQGPDTMNRNFRCLKDELETKSKELEAAIGKNRELERKLTALEAKLEEERQARIKLEEKLDALLSSRSV